MRTDRRAPCAAAAAAALVIAGMVAAGTAGATGVYGNLQLQYQKLNQDISLFMPDGSVIPRHLERELWLRTLDLHNQSYLRPNLMLDANLRLADQIDLGRDDVTHTPLGGLRLIHPWFNLNASMEPTTVRTSLAAQSGVNADSATGQQVTTRSIQTYVAGHFAPPRLPQLDLVWLRHTRDGAGSVKDMDVGRSARLTYDRGPGSVYASLGDRRETSRTPGSQVNSQQVYATGGTMRLAPLRHTALNLQYDLSGSGATLGGVHQPGTLSQYASTLADWRPPGRWSGSLGYQWRRADLGPALGAPQIDHDATALARWAPTRAASVQSSFGTRTVRTAVIGGGTRADLQQYATAVAAIDSHVRRRWSMNASFSHNTNWNPGRGPMSVETVAGATRGMISHGVQADASMQLSASSDPLAVQSRYTNSWSARAQFTPLRTLIVTTSLRSLRVGPELLRPAGVSRGRGLDLQWAPAPPVQITASLSSNGLLPNDAQRATTRSLLVKIEPSQRWQWYGTWTRSQAGAAPGIATPPARELLSTRLQYSPTHRFAIGAGASFVDPGRTFHNYQTDAVLTWSFGG
jgi:hypothetical protein